MKLTASATRGGAVATTRRRAWRLPRRGTTSGSSIAPSPRRCEAHRVDGHGIGRADRRHEAPPATTGPTISAPAETLVTCRWRPVGGRAPLSAGTAPNTAASENTNAGRREQGDRGHLGHRQHAEQVGDRDRHHEGPFGEVAPDDQPAAVAAVGNRPGDQPEQEVRHDAESEQHAGLRCRSRLGVHDQRQDHRRDRRADHRDALGRRPSGRTSARCAAIRPRPRSSCRQCRDTAFDVVEVVRVSRAGRARAAAEHRCARHRQ